MSHVHTVGGGDNSNMDQDHFDAFTTAETEDCRGGLATPLGQLVLAYCALRQATRCVRRWLGSHLKPDSPAIQSPTTIPRRGS